MSSNDSDSSAASSSHKRHKKTKRKSEKKHKKQKKEKRHKEKKRTRRDSSDDDARVRTSIENTNYKPIMQPTSTSEADSFGPALPPHLLQQSVSSSASIIGPVMPSSATVVNLPPPTAALHSDNDTDDDDAVCFGPLPVGVGENAPMTAVQLELEQRALELKLAAIAGDQTATVDQTVREEWMLELPAVGLKGGLAALSNMKRTFHQGKEKPDFSDRTSWTKTPQDANTPKPVAAKSSAEAMQSNAQAIYERQRDEEQARIAKKHKKKHKREESLVDIHQKKLRKEQKKKEKELAAAGAKPERRPFTRDIDLKLNKIDKNQTKSIVDKAKILNTKFSSGHTKYL